ncbi:MAG: trypsin-like peptidase domain-containing protein [Chloroflexota bacterium]|nr:trypsin-like peptidase domain-containing protein [Chloroflexota bacterium]
MSDRSIIGGIAAILLLGLLCVCALGTFFVVGRGELAELGAVFAIQPRQENGPAPSTAVQVEREPVPTRVVREPIPLPEDSLSIVRAEEEVLAQVYENSVPSVVNISISGQTNSLIGLQGEGSGFLWDTEGHIVTNDHVVANAQTVIVTFYDGTQRTAEVVGTDPDSDLAVIRVEEMPEGVRPLVPGDSSALRVGQRVIAIGNPFGFEGTMTLGVVSATERTVPGRMTEAGGVFNLTNLVQTDAAINPGNSGGPLLDIEGRVVGINNMIFSRNGAVNSGVGFAVPVDKVKVVVPQLIATGTFENPYLGIESSGVTNTLTPALAEALGLENVERGTLVTGVVPGGPADQAGLRGSDRQITLPGGTAVRTGGDVIVAIDDREVRDFDDLVNYLDTRSVGDEVVLTIIRDGERMEVPVTLGARP